jgi:hypothetical protein
MGGTNSKFPTKGELKNMSKESLHELMDNIKEELKSTDDLKLKKKYRKNIKKLKDVLHVNHHNDMDMMDHHSDFARVRKSPVHRKSPRKSPVHRKSPVGHSAFALHRKSHAGHSAFALHRKSPVGHSAFALHRKSPVGHSAFSHHRKSPVGHSAFSHHNRSSFMMDDNSSVASSVEPSSFFGRRK